MKKMMKAVAATALTVASLMATNSASADTVLPPLELRLNGKAVYDPVANLTWLQDANNGRMTWWEANEWAASLSVLGITGWRLPGGPMVAGYNRTSSEMGNLFYTVLGGVAGSQIAEVHNEANYNLFKNIQSEDIPYWSGVEFDSGVAWDFYFSNGFQNFDVLKSGKLFAWAVHDGDVGASPVPLPGALVLMSPALLGLLGVNRRRRRGC
jgi:hypothetical protein